VEHKSFMRVEDISKSFGVVQALRRVSLDVRRGEILALVGENGAGKSTLMRILEGVFTPDHGHLFIEETPQHFTSTRDAHNKGVRVIHQEPEIVAQMSVAENIFLGNLPPIAGQFLNKAQLLQKTRELLARFAMEGELRADQLCQGLGPAQRQMIEIMRAIHAGGKLIAFDEPTSSLTDEEARRLFAIIRQLRAQGTAIIYISHRLNEIMDLADRVAVLRDGEIIDVMAKAQTSEESITRKMIGRDLTQMFPPHDKSHQGQIILDVEEMTTQHVRDISFCVRAGEVLGIGGLMGAGRSELAKGLFGFHPRIKGRVRLDGQNLPSHNIAAAIQAGMGFAPEDRKEEALLMMRSILDNAVICVPHEVSKNGFYWRQRALKLISGINDTLAIKAPSLETPVSRLSGGNQQKVVLARWLARRPKLLILDEPTRGIDVGAKAEIYALIRALTKTGLAVIVISSEMPELVGLSDRILVMAEGQITAHLSGEEMNEENILHAAMPKSTLPQSTRATSTQVHISMA